jgi:hypothetical protein
MTIKTTYSLTKFNLSSLGNNKSVVLRGVPGGTPFWINAPEKRRLWVDIECLFEAPSV